MLSMVVDYHADHMHAPNASFLQLRHQLQNCSDAKPCAAIQCKGSKILIGNLQKRMELMAQQ